MKEDRLKSIAPVENSEHLTGFSIDVVDKKDPKTFDLNGSYTSKAWQWLEKNAPKYGFEISFPRDNKQGINYEPWHLRYVGPEVPRELQLVFAYAKSGGSIDKPSLEKICKDAPKQESIEHTQDTNKTRSNGNTSSNSSRTHLDVEKVLTSYGLTALTVITGTDIYNTSKAKDSVNTASILKLPIADVIYQYVKSQSISPSKRIQISSSIVAEGESELSSGNSYTISRIINRMLEVSSNTAINTLVNYIGGPGNPINSLLSKAGYTSSKFNRYFSLPGVTTSSPNRSSTYEAAKAMAQLLKIMLNNEDEIATTIKQALSKSMIPNGMRGIVFNKHGYTYQINSNVAVYKNSNGYFIISIINNKSLDEQLTKIKDATNEITKAIDNLELRGINLDGSTLSPPKVSTPTRTSNATFLPVIMYHSVANNEANAKYRRYEITPNRFKAHMERLKSLGYQSVSSDQILSGNLPDKPIVITLDDGSLNNLTQAAPIMEANGFRGLFFIPVKWIGSTHLEYDIPIMNNSQLKQIVKRGHEIGSHSLNHKNLTKLNTSELNEEIIQSKNQLESRLGVNIKSFSYPFGAANSEVIKTVSRNYPLAYMAFLTSSNPRNDKHMIPRVEIGSDVTADELQDLVEDKSRFLIL